MSRESWDKTALVFGAGGFIGNAMVKRLQSEGYWVRGVDLKEPDFGKSEADEFITLDLRDRKNVDAACILEVGLYDHPLSFGLYRRPFEKAKHFDEIYQFAADMGGAGYVFSGENDANIMHNSVSINIHLLDVLRENKFTGKVFYSSSACMYPQELQYSSEMKISSDVRGLRERDAYPANPDSEYGWEKLFSERLYLAYARNHDLNVRIARFHNIYGPEGTYKGGKEKAPAAMCRKVISTLPHAHLYNPGPEILIWGDGKQTRSFLYIDDCIDAVRLLMQSDFKEPINIGSEEMVSIDDLADVAIELGRVRFIKKYDLTKPQGVRGRNSDNTLIRKVLGWEPKVSLRDGMATTFSWIKSQMQ